MNGSSDALWVAASAAAVASLSLTLSIRPTRAPRGWRLWMGAIWLGTGGLVLSAVAAPRSLLAPLAQLLLLQWPMLVLLGLRRFHARVDWPGQERHDHGTLAACSLLALVAGLLPPDSPLAPLLGPVAWLGVHLYVASVLVCAGSRQEARSLQLLAAMVTLAACAPVVSSLPGMEPRTLFEATAVSTAMALVALGFLLKTLMFDRDERHLRASRRRLRALASIDPLTQVPNRRHFAELATRMLEHDPPASAVLLMFDVDHFKRINDELGHAGGDRALRLVSRCVREVLRVQDLPCRHGGDEFVLLLRHASVRDAMRVAARLVARVQQQAGSAGLPLLSLSFGVVQVRPAEALDQALRRADQALYEAKRQGRSRAVAGTGTDAEPQFTESRPLGLINA